MFLDESSHLLNRLCRLVGRLVGRFVGWVTHSLKTSNSCIFSTEKWSWPSKRSIHLLIHSINHSFIHKWHSFIKIHSFIKNIHSKGTHRWPTWACFFICRLIHQSDHSFPIIQKSFDKFLLKKKRTKRIKLPCPASSGINCVLSPFLFLSSLESSTHARNTIFHTFSY